MHLVVAILSNRKNFRPGDQVNGYALCFRLSLKYAQPIFGSSKLESAPKNMSAQQRAK